MQARGSGCHGASAGYWDLVCCFFFLQFRNLTSSSMGFFSAPCGDEVTGITPPAHPVGIFPPPKQRLCPGRRLRGCPVPRPPLPGAWVRPSLLPDHPRLWQAYFWDTLQKAASFFSLRKFCWVFIYSSIFLTFRCVKTEV